MRHASHVDGTLTAEGIADCVEIGGALRQVIADLGIEPSPETLRVMYAPSSEAWQSAEVATREVGSHLKLESATVLQPPKGALSLDRTALDESVNAAVKCILKGEQKIVLVVGHLPLLSWVARRLVGVALPIGRAELLAIDVAAAADREKRTGILRWTLTPERRSKELIVEIREKIKSKMEAAKYLASFVTATLGVQVALMFEPAKLDALQKSGGSAQAPMLAFSAVLMSLSAALYFVTVFAYDKLLSAWKEGRVR